MSATTSANVGVPALEPGGVAGGAAAGGAAGGGVPGAGGGVPGAGGGGPSEPFSGAPAAIHFATFSISSSVIFWPLPDGGIADSSFLSVVAPLSSTTFSGSPLSARTRLLSAPLPFSMSLTVPPPPDHSNL